MKFFFMALATLAAVSCASQKRTIYLQDVSTGDSFPLSENTLIHIKPHDRLTVIVSASDPELAAPFNAFTSYGALTGTPITGPKAFTATMAVSNEQLQVITVDDHGEILLPILGRMKAAGLTRGELAEEIEQRIIGGGYIAQPSVNIQFDKSMVFSVVGEVAKPGRYEVASDRISIFEALAAAGDMTIQGQRRDVTVMRVGLDGIKRAEVIDLTSKNAMLSPYYYIQPGDEIYVRPNKSRSQAAYVNPNQGFYISLVGALVSAISVTLSIISFSR